MAASDSRDIGFESSLQACCPNLCNNAQDIYMMSLLEHHVHALSSCDLHF